MTLLEKKWVAYQLLCSLSQCHSKGISHGDIKSENILVTSWNWIFLSDFAAPFKPAFLPEDHTADFSFFFDSMARRSCYVAPERFYSKDKGYPEGGVRPCLPPPCLWAHTVLHYTPHHSDSDTT